MPFVKENLVSDHYKWSYENHSTVFNGPPSRRLFDRFNGDQVLFIINFYGTISDKVSVKEGRKMEEMIKSSLPIEAKSEISVFNWLRNAC